MQDFREGEPYFRLSFLDKEASQPVIDTLIFVGKNLSHDEAEDALYFQDPHSYNAHGSAIQSEIPSAEIICYPKSEVTGILDLSQLLGELTRLQQRGFP